MLNCIENEIVLHESKSLLIELKTARVMMPPPVHVCNGLARPADEFMLTSGQRDRLSGQRDIVKT